MLLLWTIRIRFFVFFFLVAAPFPCAAALLLLLAGAPPLPPHARQPETQPHRRRSSPTVPVTIDVASSGSAQSSTTNADLNRLLDLPIDRRNACAQSLRLAAAFVPAAASAEATKEEVALGPVDQATPSSSEEEEEEEAHRWTVTLPLEPCGGGGGFCVRLTVVGAEEVEEDRGKPFRVYRAIVDTGSPYLVVPASSSSSVGRRFVLSSGYLPSTSSSSVPYKRLDGAGGPLAFLDGLLSWKGGLPCAVRDGLESMGINFRAGICSYIDDDEEEYADQPFPFGPSVYPPTNEIYGAVGGTIEWRSTSVTFRDRNLVVVVDSPRDNAKDNDAGVQRNGFDHGGTPEGAKLVLGVMDDDLTNESGGPLLGLVKRSNGSSTKIERRPTFFNQAAILPPPRRLPFSSFIEDGGGIGDDGPRKEETAARTPLPVASFAIDGPNRSLVLSTGPLIPSNSNPIDSNSINDSEGNVLPLVDLRPIGDFVEHYACLVEEVIFTWKETTTVMTREGRTSSSRKGRPSSSTTTTTGTTGFRTTRRDVVAVFDTGLTGCLLTRPFWDELRGREEVDKEAGESAMDPSEITSVEVRIRTVDRCLRRSRDGKGEGTMREERVRSWPGFGAPKPPSSLRLPPPSSTSLYSIESGVRQSPLFYVRPIDLDWFDDENSAPHVIVLGQAFLRRGTLTVDVDDRVATFDAANS